ncbi:MAG: hypothetical protein JXK05_02045 [Campylobacterales bacterium]|nr:hypothetical protein [Campylobacterales bacterium]
MKTLMKLLLFLFPLYMYAANVTVSNLHLTSADDGRPNPSFAWDANPDADGYEVSSDGGLHWVDVGNVTAYTFSNLSSGNYAVVVRAYTFAVSVPLFGAAGALLLALLFGVGAHRRLGRSEAV